jgi:hypothetical protein
MALRIRVSVGTARCEARNPRHTFKRFLGQNRKIGRREAAERKNYPEAVPNGECRRRPSVIAVWRVYSSGDGPLSVSNLLVRNSAALTARP